MNLEHRNNTQLFQRGSVISLRPLVDLSQASTYCRSVKPLLTKAFCALCLTLRKPPVQLLLQRIEAGDTTWIRTPNFNRHTIYINMIRTGEFRCSTIEFSVELRVFFFEKEEDKNWEFRWTERMGEGKSLTLITRGVRMGFVE